MSNHPPSNFNKPAQDAPYYTPVQEPPAGTATDPQPKNQKIPDLFQPIQIRGVVFQNRIWVSPMCQYSAEDGFVTPWHMSHLGGIITRGPGHTMIEATAVTPNGRITPQDVGIWSDAHINGLSQLVIFAHSQTQKIGIQLAHAGRKASTIAPWITGPPLASEAVHGWPDDVWAPSAIAYEESYPHPKQLTKEGIKDVVKEFGESAKRAVKAGFDVIEIHGAHGYLISSFLSPASNKRTDEYGGSFENRIRFALEVVDKVRSVIPDTMPLFFRISATDWLEKTLPNEPSWTSSDTARFAPILYAHGIDFLDVSSGGNHPAQKINGGPAYQAPFAKDVMNFIGTKSIYPPPTTIKNNANKPPTRLIVGTVGSITSGVRAQALLENGYADVIVVGRQFLRNPGTVWAWADELDVEVRLASQIGWGFKGRGKKSSDGKEDHREGSEKKRCKV